MVYKFSIGQDSHRFEEKDCTKKLILGGLEIEGYPGLSGNSDADVVLHALANAISGVTCINILGAVSDRLCLEDGITDSRFYVLEALKYLSPGKIVHVSISIEAQRPKFAPVIPKMREKIGELLGISPSVIGITATSGEGLTAFGKGEGIFCTVGLTTSYPDEKSGE